ncbi:MAG: FAD-dependent oxidoreductase [Solirubrobacterales bacterium]|nr:FAD-dependent oxidoreductase [Solirubrobacterales bacterium]
MVSGGPSSRASHVDRARIAVIGGGVAGCSLLYHLATLGQTDCVLLEQSELTSGSTWHAAGLCTQYNTNRTLMRLLRYSVELYERIAEETGQAVDFHQCGSIRLAANQDRVDELLYVNGIADVVGVPLEIIDPERVVELWPPATADDVLAAAYLPTDGHVDPTSLTNALAAGALAAGARIHRQTRVTALEPRRGGGWRIETNRGSVIEADVVANAAGQWAREVGQLAGLDLPIRSIEHQYLTTDQVPGLPRGGAELPVLRDPEASFYVRQEIDSLLVGPFERNPRSWALEGIPPGFHGRLLPGRLEQIEDVLIDVAHRIPGFDELGIKRIINGPDGYTPDGHCLMGPAAGIRNFWVLAGFSIFGIVFAGGAGRLAAEWLVDGRPSDDVWSLDVRRFGEYAESTKYVAAKARQVYEREYAVHYPHEELPVARGLKTSAIHDRLVERGAVFGERSGWERPLWFASDPSAARDHYSFRRPGWHEAVAAECRAVRSSVGVLDQTSFAKYEIFGVNAEALLDRLCANKLPRREGRIALTQMCNRDGGVECDVTVTRLADRFYVVSAAATEAHDLAWIQEHMPDSGVRVENVTAARGVITLAGPRSRELLQRITSIDVSDQAFKFFTAQQIRVGLAPARVMRLSYVGELGFELHVGIEYQRYVYDLVREAGATLGLVDFGYRALDSLRLEMGFRLWGADMSPQYTALEAGMERFVDLGKEFIGRDALAQQAAQGVAVRLCSLVIDADDADPHAYEPVYSGDYLIGSIDAGGYGHTMETALALTYLPIAFATAGTRLEVEILGQRRPAIVVRMPPLRSWSRLPAAAAAEP